MLHDIAATLMILRRLTRIADPARSAPAISQWCISQHLDHIIQVNQSICTRISGEVPDDPGILPVRFIARIVLLTKHIPRGRGTAPAALMPRTTADPEIMRRLDQHLAALESLHEPLAAAILRPGRFNHPVFGGLNRKQWLRFVHVHTLHHAKIIDDIT